jgi:hypothetical protein
MSVTSLTAVKALGERERTRRPQGRGEAEDFEWESEGTRIRTSLPTVPGDS